MKPKRLVRYDPSFPVHFVGGAALVRPLDHDGKAVTNTKMIMTSRVVKIDDNGCFETENSLYIPATIQ